MQENWTALMAASNNGRSEAADALLQHRADPNRQDHVRFEKNESEKALTYNVCVLGGLVSSACFSAPSKCSRGKW